MTTTQIAHMGLWVLSPQPKQIDLLKLSDDIAMPSVASYDYPNDEDRPRSVSQLAKSYQQNTSAISPPSYYNSTPSSLSYTKSTSNIEPPEQSSPHSVLSTHNTNNMSGSNATAEDPPEQSLSTKFNMSTSNANTHSRIRANIMSTSSIHNISRNAKGHVYLNGEDSSVDDISSSCGGDATFGKHENKSVKIANEVHKIEPYGNNNNQQREIMLGRNGRKLNPSSAIVLDKHLSGQASASSSSSPTIKQKQLSKKEQRERNSIALAKQFNYNNNHTSPSPGQSTYEYKEKLKDDDDSHVNYGYKVEDTTHSSNKRDVAKFADKYGGQISKTRSWDEEEGVYSSNQGSRLGSNSSNNTKGAWRGNTQSSCDASVGSTETRRSNVVVSSPVTSIPSKPTVQYVASSLSSTSRYTKSNFPPSYFRGVRTKKLPAFHTTNNKSSSWLCGSCVGHQQHGYLKKNAAILIVLVCIVCITTLSYFGLGGSSGTNEGIESQLNHIETTGYATSGSSIRGLTDGYNNQQQQLPMTAGYAQEMGYSTDGQEQQSTKGIMDGVHPLPSFSMGNTNNNGVIDWSTSQTTTGVGGQQVVDWSKVPPHLRGYYSKMVNVNAAQQSEQEEVMSLEEQIDQGTSAQELFVDSNMDTSNVETVNVETTINAGEVAVPVIDMEEFARQQEVLEFNAGVAGIQEPPPPTVDDQSSSLPVDGSPQGVLPESLQGIDIQQDTSIPDESNIPEQVENTDEGSIIEGQEEEPEYGMTMEEHEQMEQRIQQEEAEKLAIERLELQRGGGDQLSGGQQVVEILPATTVPGEDVQQQELLEQQSLELQGDAYNDQETLLTSINEEEVARQKQAEEDALLKAATIEEDQRASREQNPPELDDEVAESEEQVVMNVSEEEEEVVLDTTSEIPPAESLSPQEEVDQLENVQDQEGAGQVLLDNEVQAEDSLNEQQQLDNEPQEVNQQENNDEDESRIKKKKGKKKQKELEKLLKKEQKFQQRKQERIEQLKKERREAKKRKKQNQDMNIGDESNDSEIEDEKVSEETSTTTTIDQLQKELNELAALLSQKT